MNYRLLSLLVLIFLNTIAAPAQKDLKNGYIITNTQDTLYGLVNLKSNIINSKECEFYSFEKELIETYKPNDIIGYRIDGYKYYVTKKIEIDNIESEVFLEFILNGVINLYYYKKTSSLDYYFIEKNGQLYELSNDEVLIKNEWGDIYSKNTNQYLGALNYLLSDSPEIKNELKHTKFSYKSLLKTANTYHNLVCDDGKCILYSKKIKNTLKFEPLLGINLYSFSLKNGNNSLYNIGPKAGMNILINSSKMNYKTSLLTGICYNYILVDGEIETTDLYVSGERNHNIYLRYSKIVVPIGINYIIQREVISPSLFIAYNNVFNIEHENVVKSISSFKELSVFELGLMAGVGLNYKLSDNYLNIKINYEFNLPATNINRILDYRRMHSYSLTVGFVFN